MTTAFAFLFANNAVFKKDRERLMESLESREAFEKFLISGQWLGKDSFASEVAKDALVVFDPLGIAEETLRKEKKEKASKEKAKAKASKEKAKPPEKIESKIESKSASASAPASASASEAEKKEKAPEKADKGGFWTGFFGGGKETESVAEKTAKPKAPALEPKAMDDAFMAFGSTLETPAPPSPPAETPPPPPVASSKPTSKPSTPPSTPGYSKFQPSKGGASKPSSTGSVVGKPPADPNSPAAIQYRKDLAASKAAGVPYSTWVKKSREDLTKLSWQELAERMKKPYQPGDYSTGGGTAGGGPPNKKNQGPR